MVAPINIHRRSLTGRVRGRVTWRNKVIMQVEELCAEVPPWTKPDDKNPDILSIHYEWRDATVDDILSGVIYCQS